MPKFMISICLLVLLLYGCAKEDGATRTSESEIDTPAKQKTSHEQDKKEEERKLVKSYFSQMIEAVNNDDKESFLTFQNAANPLFYKEQERWIEEAIFKKKQGYSFTVDIGEINLISPENGTIELTVNMNYQDTQSNNKIIYSIIKSNNEWKLDDVPFSVLKEGNISVFYTTNLEEQAKTTLKEASEIIRLYRNEFGWEPKEITIKLYDSKETVSASIPWPGLTGWNEVGESIKFMSEPFGASNISFKVLAHELGHKMLSDFSNDNLSLYLQEGFATLLQSVVEKDETGKPVINFDHLSDAGQTVLENEKLVLLPISDLNKLDYNQSLEIYAAGFLLTDYLVTTHGIDSFLHMVKGLVRDPYIDIRTEHKSTTLSERTSIGLEKEYGDISRVSEEYKKFFEKQ